MKRLLLFLFLLTAPAALMPAADSETLPPFELRDGDRVLFVGDTLIEREQRYGYIETMLTLMHPDRRFTFRNLGWSADLPNGRSRASFDWNKPADVWFAKLTNQVAIVDPTVVFVGYGMAASFDGEAGVAGFERDLTRLVEAIRANAGHEVRFALMSPLAHLNIEGPFPTGEEHNKSLALYADAIRRVAEKQAARYVDLYNPAGPVITPASDPLISHNGIHLTPAGYSQLADAVRLALGLPSSSWRAGIMEDGLVRDGGYGVAISKVERTNSKITYTALPEVLPAPVAVDTNGAIIDMQERIRVQFQALPEGDYDLLMDGQRVVESQSAALWRRSRLINRGSLYDRSEEVRQAILRKNELFMHRWRPQNETYLFGFRKHEQGQNAAEVLRFDAEVAAVEEEIHRLKQPFEVTIELRTAGAPGSVVDAVFVDRRIAPPPADAWVNHRPDPKPKIPFEIAEGFEINLFAEDPLLAKPIQMAWDNDGRLYVASSETYPQVRPGDPANDKIIVLMDIDGDGTADRSQVFADGLLIPTGIEPGDGGVYVAHSTELVHLRDTNRDWYADQRKVVLTAFGTEDTHHLLHTLKWGFDGRLYMNQSIYVHSHIETPLGVKRLNSGGVWAYRTAGDELEVFLKGFCNPWGHIVDEFGQSFVTDGAGFQGVSWGVPGAMYFTYAGAPRILDSISPGSYPKFSGLEIVRTPNFPGDWQGDLITCDFRAHRVVRFKLEEEGAGYVTREMPDLLRTTDVNFRPIDVKLGPDGALYIADWSNPIIQHGEVDFRDQRRDKVSGRIWRVTRKGGPVELGAMRWGDLPTKSLLEQVHSANGQVQRAVFRTLKERGGAMLGELQEWTARQDTELKQLRALWLYQSIDRINPPLLRQLLGAQDGRVRAAATRVLSHWAPWVEGGEGMLAERSRDEHARVRIEAMRGLARTPSAANAALILAATELPMDKFTEYAAWLSINDAADEWIAAIENGTWSHVGKEGQLAFGLKSIPPEKAARVLGRLVPEPLPSEGSGGWIELIGAAGTARELGRLYAQALTGGFTDEALARALGALDQSARGRSLRPGQDLGRVTEFFGHQAAPVRSGAMRLAGAWKQGGDGLLAVAAKAETPAGERQLAFQSVREVGGNNTVEALLPLAGAGTPPGIRAGAVGALAGLDLRRAAPLAMGALNELSAEEALALWRSLLSNRNAGKPLADAASAVKLSPTAAAAGLRAVREGGREEPALLQVLTLASNVAEPVGELSDADMMRLAQDARVKGDPDRGEALYRQPNLACVACHAIGGVGGKVGPDLTSIGASAPADYLVESLIYPNRKIKEGYHSVVVQTKDDQEFSGVLVRQTATEVFIRNAANVEVAVAKNNVARQEQGASLMPAGLIDALNPQERLDLVRFLTELGKPGRFDAAKGTVARLWRLRQATHRDEQFSGERKIASLIEDGGWTPTPTLVDGALPRQAMQDALFTTNPNIRSSMVGLWAHARFRSSGAGSVTLQFSGADGAEVWIDGGPVKPSARLAVELPAGEHDLVVKLHPRSLPESLRVTSTDVTFLND